MPFDDSDKQYLQSLITQNVTPVSSKVVNVEERLAVLESKLAATEIIMKAQDARISAQDVLITAQKSKLDELEKRLNTESEVNKTYRSLVKKLEADVDDLEQYGRRYCVRIYNLPVKEHETEEQLFTSLKTELKKVEYNLQRGDLVNFHRLGQVKKSDKPGRPDTRQVIMRFARWGPRKSLYELNKKLRRPGVKTPIRVHNDLTKRRLDILNATKRRIDVAFGDSDEIFAYSDINSNIKVRCPDGSVMRVNSLEEAAETVRAISNQWEPIPSTDPSTVYPGSNITVDGTDPVVEEAAA